METLTRLDERTKDIQKDLKQITKTLHGNGRKGICDRMTEQETTVRNTKWAVGITLSITIVIFTIIEFLL
jgi:hypothetical protein